LANLGEVFGTDYESEAPNANEEAGDSFTKLNNYFLFIEYLESVSF